MLLPLVLALSCGTTIAQSIIPYTTSCLKRSVYVYTSDSSTYAVTNLGQTTLGDTPAFCSNVTTLPASTVTVLQQVSSIPASTTNSSITFDDGSATYGTAASGSQVVAAVASDGPLQPYSGNSYL